MPKKFLFPLLVTILVIHFLFRVYGYRESYATAYDEDYWKDRYLKSQWVVPDSRETIGDDGLYAYAGWEYTHGADPTLLNAEAPPLGKYIIGYMTVLFGNQNIYGIITGILALSTFFLLNLELFKRKVIAILPVVIFSFEPLFFEQLRSTFLDLLQLSFLFLVFTFFLKRKYLLSAIFLGCFMSVRFSTFAVIVIFSCLSYLFYANKKDVVLYLVSLVIAPIVYALTYLRFFLLGNSTIEFLKVQKWIVAFYAGGAKATPGTVIPLLLTGQWYTWFDGVQRIREWHIIWPLVTLLSAIAIPATLKDKKHQIMLIAIWSVCYFVFLIVIPVAPRYLLLLLPFLYNLSIWVLLKNTHVKSFLASY